jgi:ABC-2 type transport system ATP-binding protein
MRDRARAVNNLSFEIRPREVFGLLGPNGSGKSTTIKMILGLLRPTVGRIAVFGKSPTDVAVKARIGYLPEESYLYGFLNARETLEYYAKLFELDAATRTRRIDELLDMIGLTGAQFRPVREYSKGMQRRIGIAQALINDPDLLILDEPTTGLDPIGTRQVKDLIIELARRGKTILLSSHLLADVEECVDRLVILYGGQKRAEGTCDDLLVAQGKTSIEADSLDDSTVEEIDRVIRSRSAGAKSILRVAKPRQSLEDLFLDIVSRAKTEQVATSGATAGGSTASFLTAEGGGDAATQGDALIARLINTPASDAAAARATGAPAPNSARGSSPASAQGPDLSVIGALSTDAPSTNSAPAAGFEGARASQPASPSNAASSRATPVPAPAPSTDRSVIDSLLGGASDQSASDQPASDQPASDQPGPTDRPARDGGARP